MASTCVHLGSSQMGREWQHLGAAAPGCVNLGTLFFLSTLQHPLGSCLESSVLASLSPGVRSHVPVKVVTSPRGVKL